MPSIWIRRSKSQRQTSHAWPKKNVYQIWTLQHLYCKGMSKVKVCGQTYRQADNRQLEIKQKTPVHLIQSGCHKKTTNSLKIKLKWQVCKCFFYYLNRCELLPKTFCNVVLFQVKTLIGHLANTSVIKRQGTGRF